MRSPLTFLFRAVAALTSPLRGQSAEARLREVDEGKRCVACDGTNLHVEADVALCFGCGHRSSLAVLRGAAVSSDELRR